jgi:hypothetical protein
MFKFLRKTALWIVLVPALIFGVGVASNQAVLVANHDRFPVMWNSYKAASYALSIEKEAADAEDSGNEDARVQAAFDLEALHDGYLDDTHVLMTSKTHLNFLADWIDLKSATYSLGDLAIDAGDWGLKYCPFLWFGIAVGRLNKKEDRY